ncbi:MAG: hydrogenase, partial [Planctomycetaceae bacterium]|nr:hydrogenase [Planctomycetaceae bacterium]
NRDLREESRHGRFREDLFYRLSVFPIQLPPLRERPEDVGLLAEHFLQNAARRFGVKPPRLTKAVVNDLQRYDWPGNVRELQHVIERAVILSRGRPLRVDLESSMPSKSTRDAQPPGSLLTEAQLRDMEKANLHRALDVAGGKVYGEGGAAELLGIKPTTLLSRMRAMKISR